MSDKTFNRTRLGVFVLALEILLVCALSPDAFAQSCYNNTNPNLVMNGGFESESEFHIPHWGVAWKGTTSKGNPIDPYVTIDNDNPHEGSKELKLGTTAGTNDISQLIGGTAAASVYTVCFWLASAPDQIVGKTSFDVLWNDVTELELTQSATSPYQYYAFIVTGTGNNDDHLRFRERNDHGYYYLDDVAVQLCSGCTVEPGFNKK